MSLLGWFNFKARAVVCTEIIAVVIVVIVIIIVIVIGAPENFIQLGPGRPSAGGPRMDRRAVTSSRVVNTSRLASLHKREVPNKLESESETCMAVKLNFRLPIITFP